MTETLRQRVMRHEEFRGKPYRDTAGKLTIGYGRNLDDVGISQAEGGVLLDNDLTKASVALMQELPWTGAMPALRRDVLVEMAFNLGIGGLLKFQKMLDVCRIADWPTAAAEMLDSAWAGQVGARATELATIMKTGEAP